MDVQRGHGATEDARASYFGSSQVWLTLLFLQFVQGERHCHKHKDSRTHSPLDKSDAFCIVQTRGLCQKSWGELVVGEVKM